MIASRDEIQPASNLGLPEIPVRLAVPGMQDFNKKVNFEIVLDRIVGKG